MRCQACGDESPDNARFCMHCGSSLSRACGRCGERLEPQAPSCSRCGAPTAAADAPDPPPHTEAERRQLTVLFCDLVGSTTLAQTLGAETYAEIVRAYQQVGGPAIEDFGGYVAQYLGDGVLAYFGYPHAGEDDAERAIEAGLSILKRLEPLRERMRSDHGIGLDVRLAIHTGSVVIGEVGAGVRRERLALGESANLAARLQDTAPSNGLVISEATLRLVRGLFVTEDLGEVQLRGLSQPVRIYRALARSGTRGRLDAVRTDHLTPLIGRGQEIELLRHRFERARAGEGQVVLVSGESGIGKSRLVRELRSAIAEAPHTWLEYRCAPATRHSALSPVVDLLRRELQTTGGDAAVRSPETLEHWMRERGLPLDALPVFAELLSIPSPWEAPPVELAAERRRARLLSALVGWTLRLCERRPVVLHVDDLHWIDPSTLELLEQLVDQMEPSRLIIVATCRPDVGLATPASWSTRPFVTPIRLNRLNRAQSLQLVEHVVHQCALAPDLGHEILRRTDGVPLFLEELTRSLHEAGAFAESGRAGKSAREIPSSLADSLMARLDRLGPAKQLAQLCSVLGREFPVRLLEKVYDGSTERLGEGLARLLESDLLCLDGSGPHADYSFRHGLIQETAYASLLRPTRARLHARVAEQLERALPDVAEEQPERVAHHWTEAGRLPEALDAWERAGSHAIERSAPAEALLHLSRALELIERLPAEPARVERELRLQVARSVPLQAVYGHNSSEVQQAFERARELAEQVGDSAGLFPAMAGLSALYLVRGKVELGRDLALQALRLAERSGETLLRVWACYSLGITQLYLGELEAARQSAETGISLAGNHEPGALGARYAGDPVVDCHVVLSHALWMLGHARRAREAESAGLALAERLGHPLCLAYASLQKGTLCWMSNDPAGACLWAERARTHSRQVGATMFEGVTDCLCGWSAAVMGDTDGGIQKLLRGFRALRESGTDLILNPMSAALAEAYLKAGRIHDAHTVLDEALRALESSSVRLAEAELRRLFAQCHLMRYPDDVEGGEALLRVALDVADKQGAAPLALRIRIDLAEHVAVQGRRSEAALLIEEVSPRMDDLPVLDVDAAERTLARLRNHERPEQPPKARVPTDPEMG